MALGNRPESASARPGSGERERTILGIRLPHIYLGWWTVIAGGLLALWGYGYNAYGISALFKPISEEFGFNRAATSVASSIGRFEGGIEGPITGWITDRFGARYVILTGVFLMSLALLLMRFVNSLWSFYLIWGAMLGTGANIALSLPIDTTISNWFVKKRGIAMSIKWVFSGLSGVLVMPLIAWLIMVKDWRFACTFGGVVMGVAGLPIAWFLFKPRRPEYYGLLPDGAIEADLKEASQEKVIQRGVQYASEVKEVEFTLRQALKTLPFWMLVAVQAVNGLVGPVMSIHCIPFLTDMGIDPIKAAAMMSVWITASLPTRFIGGFIADRLRINHLRFLTASAYFVQAIGVAVFLRYQSIAIIYVWFILYGFGQGLVTSVNPLIRGRYFGRKAFGSIAGISSMIMAPIGVAGPIYAGWIYDSTGSYINAFLQFAIMLGVATVLALFVLPPRPPAEVGDVRKIV